MNSSAPVSVVQTKVEYTEHEVEVALATLRDALHQHLLVLMGFHVEALKREHAHGKLVITIHLKDGHVMSGDFERHTRWQPPPRK